jgi:hypothetical protein
VKADPEIHEEQIYKLLGLVWAGASRADVQDLAVKLINNQQPDGGWAQLPHLSSDAYATAQALYALMHGAGLDRDHSAVRAGLAFLLEHQLDDGTWHVRRRAYPFQPPMESGFPHGADSWISAAASSWAVMALSYAVEGTHTDILTAPLRPSRLPSREAPAQARVGASAAGENPLVMEYSRDIRPLLERSCVPCHSGERPKGGYRLDRRESLLGGGNRGESVAIPGHSGESLLLRLVTDQVTDMEMPPLGKRAEYPALNSEEVERLRVWIDQGASWEDDLASR